MCRSADENGKDGKKNSTKTKCAKTKTKHWSSSPIVSAVTLFTYQQFGQLKTDIERKDIQYSFGQI